ncbi:MAG: phosphoribosylaminoimidazolesuccinocarboxamide synthase [Candidatus Thermoplasmatota archaeon]|nr:phosphoribosylaminoimidazolesuccinocarboxamide synthase [Euryarchaeota archaeon]MBU4032745.1 phosphoribosylaminoimidazolesuccinocarboxamide synthase [Candidatus Thermoplasmatota archaeon]MBU4071474.1 phosphoribosylaminoimidazolesuccinocarboxamide synthase [Candidatus Thermoplasmatota archaeon]MBU4144263.1 phosphoribosylaminoimidazolesuccinocarboxamide synthase [Candidatus Thermoplasmatota archaeon]MBU4592335.1 phosphoribosylaminoimidazolesuccinocarboxamide synthase [Candidatus Thermoplasmato
MKLLVKGKVKEVFELDENTLRFRFTDQISVFDKIIPSMIPRKGESLCRGSAFWFQLAGKNGIDSHFIDMPAPNEMDVKRIRQVKKLDMPDSERKNVMLPLEFICRHFIAGSMWDRLKAGKVDKKDLGITGEPEYGMRIPEPLFEVTTKFEEFDRAITFREAMDSFGLKKEELEQARELTLKMDKLISSEVEKRGLLHVDGKKEYALGAEGQLMLIDTFGTPDEDRFWDVKAYEQGRFVELSKEFVRQYYRGTRYHEKLMEARDAGQVEPDIPELPPQMVDDTAELYAKLFERLTGQEF